MLVTSDWDPVRHRRAAELLYEKLGTRKVGGDHWSGKLSTSALSTATAISALSLCQKQQELIGHPSNGPARSLSPLIERGIDWLLREQNEDGGFGDTERSHSNIATTLLVMAAMQLAGRKDHHLELFAKAESYVTRHGSWEGLRRRYGKDKTFVVPILTNCALAGQVPWSAVPSLPFEAAALPQSWYRFAKMPVVSYAIPALVAIGQVRFHFAPPSNPFQRLLRRLCIRPTLKVLQNMQPESGGYLEAVPLTSFVLMSLAAMGISDHPVAQSAIRFLVESVLEDGSWPIDTNLATWVTSLTVRAISLDPDGRYRKELCDRETIRWLLKCQHLSRHPFTGADPGGWGWTDLSGAVPDADDTPAALLAIAEWQTKATDRSSDIEEEIDQSVRKGIRWLLRLQNRDGGWPTFCRGWGQLPFDRSGSDLTAHALRAISRWLPALENDKRYHVEMRKGIARGVAYLKKEQRPDGSWLPLWFGNQDDPQEENPIYGTSRVLLGLAALPKDGSLETMIEAGKQFLIRLQNQDGGWGGGNSLIYEKEMHRIRSEKRTGRVESNYPGILDSSNFRTPLEPIRKEQKGSSSLEETALAIEALVACGTQETFPGFIMRGLQFLYQGVEKDWIEVSWPIGFYFAKLWYHEAMYPLTFTLAALHMAEARHQNAQRG